MTPMTTSGDMTMINCSTCPLYVITEDGYVGECNIGKEVYVSNTPPRSIVATTWTPKDTRECPLYKLLAVRG